MSVTLILLSGTNLSYKPASEALRAKLAEIIECKKPAKTVLSNVSEGSSQANGSKTLTLQVIL